VIQCPVVVGCFGAGEDHARGHGLQGERIHGGVGQLADVARVQDAALGRGSGIEQRRHPL